MKSEKMEQTTIKAKQSAACFQIVLLSAFVFSYYASCDFASHIEQPQRKPFKLMFEATRSYQDKSLSAIELSVKTWCRAASYLTQTGSRPRR